MAVLQKIRKRSGLLLLAIGFALLAFVVQDLFTNGFNSQSHDVGSINGKDISFEDFRIKVANMEKSGQGTTTIQAVNQLWDQEVSIALLSAEFEKLGLRAGEKQIIEIFKNDPNIGQNPAFLNELGKFDLKKFKEYFKSNPEQAQFYKDKEKDAELNSKYQMYSSLIKGGMYTTSEDGKFQYELEANKTSFDYVVALYSSVKDSDIKISDEDYLTYMKKHEKRFKSEGTREIEYVLVEDKPSKKDEQEVKNKINTFLVGGIFYNDDLKQNDTIASFKENVDVVDYISSTSDVPYDSTYVSKQELPAEHAEALFNLANGQIYGPYMNGNYYSISKAMGRKSSAKVKASHILISWEGTQVQNKKEKRTKEQAKAKAEGLLAQAIANPGNFALLALTNSDDSSAQKGGDLGFFGPNQMVKPFNDFVFNNPIGKIGLVETDFGFHIINITDKQDAVNLATVALKISPSEETTNNAYTKATKFEMDATGKDFATAAKKAGLTFGPIVKAKPLDENFGTVGNQRAIIKWAYSNETSVGDLKRFEVANIGHVIAKLKKINDKGLMTVEEAKPMIENILKNEKKAEKLIAKMKGSSIESIAKATATTVQQAVDVTVVNPTLAGVGYEQKVVGTAFGTPVNKVSAPIQGNNGVYVIKTKSVSKAPKLNSTIDYVNKLKSNASQAISRMITALKSDADIEDNRLEFY